MTTIRLTLISLFLGLTGISAPLHAADIDIYSGLSGPGAIPNVLIVMDNAANFSASATGAGTCTLTNTATGVTAPNAMAGKVAGIEQCAIYQVLTDLLVDSKGNARVNVGFMTYNATSMTDYQGLNCGGSTGGCLVYPLTPMSGATRQNLLNWITTWDFTGGAGKFQIKSTGGPATAATLQEAWAYYAGKTGLSGRLYPGVPAGCQQNFVIYIGNSFGSAGTPGDSSSGGPAAALTSAYGTTPVPSPNPILSTLKTVCSPGTFTFDAGVSTHENKGEYADEWSRFMHSTDIFSGTSGVQNIVTYAIGVVDPAQCQAIYEATLMSTAAYGGGKYFQTSDTGSLKQAMLKILNEVQAVNSVFSSATLPVSVNTQGTYLNQVFMGMFRPDSGGNPRWVGNLKQYQFWLDFATVPPGVFLSDVTKQRAISSSGTGFISSNAISFWSCSNATNVGTLTTSLSLSAASASAITCPAATTTSGGTDPAAGFWVNNGNYVLNTAGKAYDVPDGEIVEKGGAGQQIRLANLVATYPYPPATTADSPRKLFLYCPSGTGCVANLNDPTNAFNVANTGIVASMFGTGINLQISRIDRVGNVATATTFGTHGLLPGQQVTISGATPNDYDGLITILSTPLSNTFTYTVMQNPVSPATGSYVVAYPGATGYNVSSMSRASAGATNTATVTATTATANAFAVGNTVQITGATPNSYNVAATIAAIPATPANSFQFPITVYPPASGTGTGTTNGLTGSYKVSLANTATLAISAASCSKTKVVTITTTSSGNLRTGDTVTISGDTQTGITLNGTYNNITVASGTSFSFPITGGCPGAFTGAPIVTPGPGAQIIATLTRVESATAIGTGTATATIATGLFANGDIVNITAIGLPANGSENNYVATGVTITCATNPCGTSFTYTIPVTPGQQTGTTGITASLSSGMQTITSLSLTGSTATADIVLAPAFTGFSAGQAVIVSAAAGTTTPANETAYTGGWTLASATTPVLCPLPSTSMCQTITYSGVNVTPVTPATGSFMTASAPGITPDRNSTINWIRGEDNFGDELSMCPPGTAAGTAPCPSPAVTVRPSVHGDTLHSRPIAVNYGTTGVVVYYGTNDGIYHAVNGNQTGNIGTTPPGGELWGWLKQEDLGKYNRQRTNNPVLLMPSTPPGILPQPLLKDYFVDGPTGLHQVIDGNGTTLLADITLGKRRGGRSYTTVNVTDPSNPIYRWKVSNGTTVTNAAGVTYDFTELGQTWSLPNVFKVDGYPHPVMVFGAGYDDGNEDNEPPTADVMGRGIYVLDACDPANDATCTNPGQLVWSSTPDAPVVACTTTQCQHQEPGMIYAIPSDVTVMDVDADAKIDRMYATDLGGNVWRVDLETAAGMTPDKWQVTKLAALGCSTGACAAGTTPRKMFFGTEVIGHTNNNNYDMVIVGTGDREHPLYGDQHGNSCSNCSYSVINRIYMLKDFGTGNDATKDSAGNPITNLPIIEQSSLGASNLDDCTGTTTDPNTCSTATTGAAAPLPYCQLTAAQQHQGYYISLTGGTLSTAAPSGEKAVNAPLATAGYVYFGTNQPVQPSTTSCTTNLGVARGYQLSPLCGTYGSIVYSGGGLPPSPVSGVVNITLPDGTTAQVPFIIGGADPNCKTADCSSAVAASRPKINVPTSRHRTYWYIKGK